MIGYWCYEQKIERRVNVISNPVSISDICI